MHPTLVKIDVAAFALGKDIRKIEQMVDGGTVKQSGLLWVFNFAVNPKGKHRALRFWRPELLDRGGGKLAGYRQMRIEEVISQILPASREYFNAGEVNEMFQVRPRTRIDYGVELPGKQTPRGNVYPRPALAAFLRRRWIGVGK